MAWETVVFTAGGRRLDHVSCSLRSSAEEARREASFDVAWTGAGIPCEPDDPATVTVSGTLWGTGYVRDVSGSHDEATRTYRVTFVSRTCDAIECSVDHPDGIAENCDLADIARTFDTLGIGIDAAARGARKRVHKVRPGETLFDTLERDARAQGIMIQDTADGRLRLADRPEGRHATALVRGVNIEAGQGRLSGATSHDPVTVRGQNSHGVTPPVLRPEARAKGGARRRRPLILVHEGEITEPRARKRAEWEAKRGAGNGISCTLTVPGWRDAGGQLWTRNWLAEVRDDWLGVDQDMVLASVTLKQDEGGTVAVLECKDPRALGGDDPKGKSAKAWAAPAGSGTRFQAT